MDSEIATTKPNGNITTGVTDLKDKCPAFKESCPFDSPAAKALKDQAKECPAFKDGCHFEKALTIQDIYEKLSKMPDVTDGSPHQRALVEVLKLIHSVSNELKGQFGQCPAFSSKQGCPFKTLCSDGKPMVHKLNEFNPEVIIHKSVIEVRKELEIVTSKGEEENDADNTEENEGKLQLANELKKGTMKVHRQAERVHFVKEFIKGRVEQKIYREAVASLYFIYTALEEESDRNAEHPLFKNIHFPKELSRVESLIKDLQFYYGNDWKDEIQVSEATQQYIDHLRDVGKREPVLLIAHHYTRYLGDLSGGQILKKMAIKAYKLPENGDGVRFYEFDSIKDLAEFKNFYRKKLDGIKVDQETADQLVEEAKVSFSLNINLFKELDRLAGFEEEIVHEEVEAIPSDQKPIDVPISNIRTEGLGSKHVLKEAPLDWLKALAAAVIAIAVLIGIVFNLRGKPE